MPTTYNFTVRATDAAGAFADRSFSIDVSNSVSDRWGIVGSAGIAFSPDGVIWRQTSGFAGIDIGFGGGVWLAISSGGANLYRTADGIVISTVAPTYTDHVGTAQTARTLRGLRYLGGAWYAWTAGGELYKSTNNGTSFQRLGPVLTGILLIVDLQRLSSGRLVLIGGSAAAHNGTTLVRYSDNDGASWTAAFSSSVSTYPARSLVAVGDSVFLANGGTIAYRSFDGANWAAWPLVYGGNMDVLAYHNGRLIYVHAPAGQYVASSSIDAGDSQTVGSVVPQNSLLASEYPHRLSSSAGRLIGVGGGGSVGTTTAATGIAGWTSVSLPMIGSAVAVAVRV